MTNEETIDRFLDAAERSNNYTNLCIHHQLHTFLSKLDPDLCHYSGIRYKSELEDCGISVDGHAKGNGWKVRISWEQDTEVLWSPNLRALLNAALKFLKDRVKA